jgi:hypothetical protein
MSQDGEPTERGHFDGSLTRTTFLIGLVVILASVYSQYVIPGLNLITGTLVVYGIPILATGLIWGKAIISKAINRTYKALKYGFRLLRGFYSLGDICGHPHFLAAADV